MKININRQDERGNLIVYIDGLIHIKIMGKINFVLACIDEVPNSDVGSREPIFMYYIQFYLESGQVVKSSYNRRDLWEQILKGLDV